MYNLDIQDSKYEDSKELISIIHDPSVDTVVCIYYDSHYFFTAPKSHLGINHPWYSKEYWVERLMHHHCGKEEMRDKVVRISSKIEDTIEEKGYKNVFDK